VTKRPEELEVKILEVRPVPIPTAEGKEAVEMWITYTHGDLPPRLIRIPKEKDTPEERKKRIREDLEKAVKFKPEILKV